MITITQENKEKVRWECMARRMVTGTGSDETGTACLMSAVNFGLTGRLTDGPHPCVSEVIRHVVIGLHDYLPDAVRSGIAWRSLGPLMLGTGGDGHDQARVRLVLDWIKRSVLSDPAVPVSLGAVTSATRAKMYAQADDAAAYAARAARAARADRAAYAAREAAAHAAVYAAAYTAGVRFQAAGWSGANRPTHDAAAREAAVYAAAYTAAYAACDTAADRLAARHAYAACEAACQAAAQAANLVTGKADWTYAHPTAHAACTAAREEFWERVDAPGLVRSLCEGR